MQPLLPPIKIIRGCTRILDRVFESVIFRLMGTHTSPENNSKIPSYGTRSLIAPSLQNAARFSLVVQFIVMLLAAFVADYGEAWQICYFAFLGFCTFQFSVLLRRMASPTTMDLFLMRAGFLPTIMGTAILANHIWTLRGF
jgi:hypothetical protein